MPKYFLSTFLTSLFLTPSIALSIEINSLSELESAFNTGGDINLNQTINSGSLATTANKDFTLNGNNFTIGGTTSNPLTLGGTSGWDLVDALIINTNVDAIIKNLNMKHIDTAEDSFSGKKANLIVNKGNIALENVHFSNINSSPVINNTGTITQLINTKFDNNNSTGIENSKNITEIDNITVSNNYVTETNIKSAGILNNNGTIDNIKNSTFSNNTLTVDPRNSEVGGAAIHNKGKINEINNTIFKNNKVQDSSNNKAGMGGAYHSNVQDINGTIKNSIFSENSAKEGGAIYNKGYPSKLLTIDENTIFNANSATDGGAIYTKTNIDIKNSEFKNNTADNMGGAIYSNSETTNIKLNLDNINFTNNTAVDRGGAVAINFGSNPTKATVTNSTFKENKATKDGAGGAIYAADDIEISNSKFTENEAAWGGAITIDKYSNTIIENSIFENNKAENGGAIFNNGTLALKGTNTFKENQADTGSAINNYKNITLAENSNISFISRQNSISDIENIGKIIAKSNSTLELDKGITGNGSVVFEKGSYLKAKANITQITNTVTNEGADLLIIMNSGFKDGLYELILEDKGGKLDEEFNILPNELYEITSIRNGLYEIKLKQSTLPPTENKDPIPEKVKPYISGEAPNEPDFNEISNTISEYIQTGNTKKALDLVNIVKPTHVIPANMIALTNKIFDQTNKRLENNSSLNTADIITTDKENKITIWLNTLYNNVKLDTNDGFDTNTAGVVLGLEKEFDNHIKGGAGFAYADTNIDVTATNGDIKGNSFTGYIYGKYQPNNWYTISTFLYNQGHYDESKRALNINITSDYDTKTYAFETLTGYDIIFDKTTFSPEAGVRFAHINQQGYTDSIKQQVEKFNDYAFTALLGGKVSTTYRLPYEQDVLLEARLMFSYDFKRPDKLTNVYLPNGDSYKIKPTTTNRFGQEMSLKLKTNINENIDIELGYFGRFKKSYTDNAIMFGINYKFK